MKLGRYLVFVLTVLPTLPCTALSRSEGPKLDHDYAKFRAALVDDVHYDLQFALDGKKENFTGQVTASFDLKRAADHLTIDFLEGKIQSLKINGKDSPITYNGVFLKLDKSHLRQGANKLTIQFTHPYSKTGAGLYRFTDPEDNRPYLYTDFEPYDANRLFPCFDQPDLKATYTMQVDAPKDWQVISTVMETSNTPKGERRQWSFPKSAKFSTYIFALHAGPYHVWTDAKARIPSRLFARRSLAQYVNPEDWFRPTRQGFDFFEKYFAIDYPFKKYDQILVPDFNSGAMENVAAVTFKDRRYVHRGQETKSHRHRRVNVILHEMAHMWFGNLVTMKWWDDLWLNESFATYMASLAMSRATEFKDAWKYFYSGTKQWAYWEDQLVTTHPIVANVPSTDQAFANFDGITYGKGASSLKQLDFLLGGNRFRDGVRSYFKEKGYQNATLKDFVRHLAKASGRNLDGWVSQWLQKESLNTITADFSCQDGKINRFSLLQTAPDEFPLLRSHRTKIGLYRSAKNKVEHYHDVSVSYAKAQTKVNALIGQPCPDFVFPNHEDHDFVKVSLDPQSLRFAQKNLANFADPMARTMIWQSMWDMVREATYPIQDYATLALGNIGQETDALIIQSVVGKLSSHRKSSVLNYYPRKTKQERQRYDAFRRQLHSFSWAQMEGSKPGSDEQRAWFRSAARTTFDQDLRPRFKKILDESIKVKGLVLDQDLRWSLVKLLHLTDDDEAATYLKKEEKRDPSSRGVKSALAATILRPKAAVKAQWWKEINDNPDDRPLAELKVAMGSMFSIFYPHLTETYLNSYFQQLAQHEKDKDNVFLSSFTRSMVPRLCAQASIDQMSSYLKVHTKGSPLVRKRLRVARQEDQRCMAILARARRGTSG